MKFYRPFTSIGKFYKRLLLRQPLLISSLTTGILSGMGDYMSQRFIEKRKEISLKRTAKMSFLGLSFFGPHGMLYY